MNILVLTNKLPYPPRDGGSIATLNMLTGLRDSGHRVTCLSLNTSKHSFPPDKIPPSLSSTIRFLGIECNTDIRPVRLLLNLLFAKGPYIAERFLVNAYREALAHLLGEGTFDIIQLEGPYPGLYLDTIRNLSDARISLRAHNVEHLIWERKAFNEKKRIRKWYFRNLSRRLKEFELGTVMKADYLVTISEEDERFFIKQGYPKHVITIPAGMHLDEYSLTDLPEEASLFYIGALDWLPNQEGLEWFLDYVWDELYSKVPGIRLHVAGRNAPGPFVKKLNRKGITYHGEVEDAKSFMQAYRVMIAPLFTGSGIRIKILEGMAMGRPVVTTPAGIEGIPAGYGKEVLIAGDAPQFVRQVEKLISDGELAGHLATEGRKLIREKFDTLALSARLSRFYEKEV